MSKSWGWAFSPPARRTNSARRCPPLPLITKELERQHEVSPDLHANLQLLRAQVDNCKRIITSLTSSAGLERAGQANRQSVEEFLASVREKWALIRPQVHVELRCHGIGATPQIIGSETVRQTLINILNNAADASPHAVELEGTWTESEIVVEVRDRGPGITEELAQKAGRRFFSTKASGHGIGLFLANATIERLGGRVVAVKPRWRWRMHPDKRPAGADGRHMNGISTDCRCLLLVDDDAVFVHVLGRALASRGFGVDSARNFGDALIAIERQRHDFAVIDLRIPGGSGLALIERLRQRNSDMRIVVLTGFASVATAVEAIKLGATHCLPKPADAEEIVAAFGRDLGNAAAPLVLSRCRWTDWNGSTFRKFLGNMPETFPPRRARSTCIAAPCRES